MNLLSIWPALKESNLHPRVRSTIYESIIRRAVIFYYKYLVFKHLRSRNVSYTNHFRFAVGAGIVLMLAGLASIIHAVIPAVLTGYSERKVTALARLARQRNANLYRKS